MRLRFDERELLLLRGAEQVRGAALAATPRTDQLRTALSLAKAGRKLAQARPGASVVLDETEVRLLVDALKFTNDEIRWAARAPETDRSPRREAVMNGFPELSERGAWRGFGLSRELDDVTARLTTALSA